jgi:hypothetical protein
LLLCCGVMGKVGEVSNFLLALCSFSGVIMSWQTHDICLLHEGPCNSVANVQKLFRTSFHVTLYYTVSKASWQKGVVHICIIGDIWFNSIIVRCMSCQKGVMLMLMWSDSWTVSIFLGCAKYSFLSIGNRHLCWKAGYREIKGRRSTRWWCHQYWREWVKWRWWRGGGRRGKRLCR